jgi:uncharacterized membrane-anchored protein
MEKRILYKDIFILRADQSRTQNTNVYKVYFWVLVGIMLLPVATTQLTMMSVTMCGTTLSPLVLVSNSMTICDPRFLMDDRNYPYWGGIRILRAIFRYVT